VCSEAGVEAVACSVAGDKVVMCSGARIEDNRQRWHRRQAAVARRCLGQQKSEGTWQFRKNS
jgi:hypothetical protein